MRLLTLTLLCTTSLRAERLILIPITFLCILTLHLRHTASLYILCVVNRTPTTALCVLYPFRVPTNPLGILDLDLMQDASTRILILIVRCDALP